MTYLPLAQIVVAIILIVLILLQQRGAGLGSLFGGGGGGSGFYGTMRGIQQKIFYATIVFGAAFIILAVLNLFLQ